ncbi:hypothetical protein ACKWTF_004909 [Chironomus riparius]
MGSRKNKKSLANNANSRKNEDMSKMRCDLLKLDIECLNLELEEKDAMISRLKDELKLKKVIINQKDIIIAQYDDKLKKKDIVIDHHVLEMKRKEDILIKQEEILVYYQEVVHEKDLIIEQHAADTMELNHIIDEKELVIMSKEDIIENKLEIIKAQDHKIAQLISSTKRMSENIYKLEEANKVKIESRKRKRNSEKGVTHSDVLNDAARKTMNENVENANPNVPSNVLDVSLSRITNQLLKMMDDDQHGSIFKSCIKEPSKKKDVYKYNH